MIIKQFKQFYFSLYILLFFFGCNPQNTNTENSNKTTFEEIHFNYLTKNKNFVSAHRGGSGIKNFPENCIETLDYLYNKGIQIVEIDIAETKDKELILMHDNSLQRTSTGKQDVNQINLTELKKYNLIDDFGNKTTYKIPTFDEALKWGKGKRIYFMVDIKKGVDYNTIVSIIKKNNMQNQVVLVTYTIGQAKKMHQIAPDILLSVSMRNDREFNEMMNSGIPTNRMVAFTGTKLNDKSLYDKIHAQNILVIFGTLGNLDKSNLAKNGQLYRELEKDGVDIFATDRAVYVHQTINKN